MEKPMTIPEADEWLRSNTHPSLTTIEDFNEIFPKFMEAHAEFVYIKTIFARMSAYYKIIAPLLADFAITHPSICRELPTQADGATRYEVICNGIAYSLVMTADGWVRENGDDKTQDFLASLPREWIKAPLQLDTIAMKRSATGEEIARAGLIQRLKPKWSL